MKRIDFARPTYDVKAAESAFHKYLKGNIEDNGILQIKDFESALSRYLGVKYCVCVNSGTTGLMLAIKSLGLDKEVIVPSFTFSSTVHSLVWNGITPRFTDIDIASYNLDIDRVRQNITAKTSAILAVNMFGNPCDIKALEEIAEEHKLRLIFDSAHAFSSQYAGKLLGGFGDLEVFSFQTTKILSAIEGGAVATNNEALYKKLLIMRSQGNRGDGDCLYVGLNARMHPVAAILGKTGLNNIDKNIRVRRKLGSYYLSLLSGIPGLRFQQVNAKSVCNHQYMPVLIDKNIFGVSRDRLAQELEKNGISVRKYFHPPVHRFSCYRNVKIHSPLQNTEFVSDNILCLPFYASMRPEAIEYVCRKIHRIQQKYGHK